VADKNREAINQHYSTGNLGDRLLAQLAESGKDIDRLTPEDLESLDQFHLRGYEATRELAALAEVGAQAHVLDVGSGIGGPARALAHASGCRVTGIDLTEEFTQVAAMLTTRTGLADRVSFRHGDALDMLFLDAAFDLVWSQHALMNIPDKSGLYAQLHRVLKPGGRYACYEIVAGPAGGPEFPVPWARDHAISHLVTASQMRDQLASAGFEPLTWNDDTTKALAWIEAQRPDKPAAGGAAADGPDAGGKRPARAGVIHDEEFKVMARNVRRALQEDRLQVVQVVLSR
jgi:MPBQ/MSBQ methyltransferase